MATIVLSGDLGVLDSEEEFLLIADIECINRFKQKYSNSIIESLIIYGTQFIVIPDTSANRDIVLHGSQNVVQQEILGANKYEGQMLNGKPHGKGTMIYGDGKKYIGDFVNGLRHGQGILIMPNGESFKGTFQNDSITEQGIYYDDNGHIREISRQSKSKLLWDKSWRFFASILCFALAFFSGWLIVEFFSTGKGGVVRVGGFVAPFAFAWWGVKNLIGFFVNLFYSKNSN